jgi:hypothetical protein
MEITPMVNKEDEKKATPTEVVGFLEKTPCNWFIVPMEGDQIEATAATTRETFVGTVAEFNAKLRA